MADDKTKTGPADSTRVNVNEDYELRYWSVKFGCTHNELKAAVKLRPEPTDLAAQVRFLPKTPNSDEIIAAIGGPLSCSSM